MIDPATDAMITELKRQRDTALADCVRYVRETALANADRDAALKELAAIKDAQRVLA